MDGFNDSGGFCTVGQLAFYFRNFIRQRSQSNRTYPCIRARFIKLGLDENMYSVSIPLGATINMDGAAITIAVMTLAAVNTLGIHVDIPTADYYSWKKNGKSLPKKF